MNIVAELTFNPAQFNSGRKNHAGVWRIRGCVLWGARPIFRARVIDEFVSDPATGCVNGKIKVLQIPVVRSYQRGAIVNPLKLALEYLRDADIIYFGRLAHGESQYHT